MLLILCSILVQLITFNYNHDPHSVYNNIWILKTSLVLRIEIIEYIIILNSSVDFNIIFESDLKKRQLYYLMNNPTFENWRTIDGYPNYQVSSCGRVMNVKTSRILKLTADQLGYYMITLCKNGVTKKNWYSSFSNWIYRKSR